MCTLIRYLGFMGTFFNCLVGCLSMTVRTAGVLGVLHAWVWHFCMCICSAQLSMFHMKRCSRNTVISFLLLIIVFSV